MKTDSTIADQITHNLLQLIQALIDELHPKKFQPEQLTLDSEFEKDLGLDSLTRVELISRIERQFEQVLPERLYTEAETPRDLLRALLSAKQPGRSIRLAEIKRPIMDETPLTPVQATTLIEVLNWHVLHQPDRPHIQIYQDDGMGETMSFQQLKTGADKVAAGLQQLGLTHADTVSIMLPTGPEYFYSFFGILIAGGIPVPIYPPTRPSQLEDHIRRHIHILNNCRAKFLITVPEAIHIAQLVRSQVVTLKIITTVTDLSQHVTFAAPVISPGDTAFIQYTSGSTGNPKGVVLTHANLLANIRAMGQAVNAGPADVFVSWLPLYHDMGLIGAWFGSLYYAALFVVMQPMSFLARPERWLWAIHHFKGTLSAAPNFGYEYCLRRLQEQDIKDLDLSSWRVAFNGAEAVSAETITNFQQRFAASHFKPETMMPVYGLAESSVGLAFPPLGRGPLIDSIKRDVFMRSGHAIEAEPAEPNVLRFVSCGLPLNQHAFRIIDISGHELPERQEGKIEFRGPSSTSGYFRDAEKTRELFDGDWLDSGDLGYIANGELYVTGRIKDIIIRAGRNIYPHELEEAVGNISEIRKGRVAVFGSKDSHSGTERLIILAETHNKDPVIHNRLTSEINTLAVDLTGSPPDEIVLAPPGSVLKTSSGKIRRAASRELFEKGDIRKHKRSVILQIIRLTLSGILPQARRLLRVIQSLAYGIYCWCGYLTLAPVVWLTATLHPNFDTRWHVMSFCSGLLAKITSIRIIINGLHNIPADGRAYVLVANHSSYIDSYVLVAILPEPFRFVAKKELADSFLTRMPLAAINTEFIARADLSQSIEETRHLTELVKSGEKLMFFAEGTFTRAPGLMPFHLGAFNVAATARVPVIPIAIRGTRSVLRNGSRFPRHGTIHVEIGMPIDPREIMPDAEVNIWKVSIALRQRSRDFILRYCGEPDLEGKSV